MSAITKTLSTIAVSPAINQVEMIVHSKARILVAEDNILNQQIVGKMLTSLGYSNVEFAENGKVAVEAALQRKFDLVLMDVMVISLKVSAQNEDA